MSRCDISGIVSLLLRVWSNHISCFNIIFILIISFLNSIAWDQIYSCEDPYSNLDFHNNNLLLLFDIPALIKLRFLENLNSSKNQNNQGHDVIER